MLSIWLRVQAHLGSLRRGASPERGQTLTEYALILGFVVIVLILALTVFGEALQDIYDSIGVAVDGVFDS